MPAERHRAQKAAGPAEIKPALHAIPFLPPIHPEAPLLTDSQRMQLAAIATSVRMAARTIVYRDDTPATSVFIIAEGVVKAYKELSSGRRWVTAFLYPADVFGLSENGRYVRTAQTVTPVLLYQFHVNVLIETLKNDGELQFKFLCKLTHELRESQRQTIAVGRKDAVGRIAMFIRQLERGNSGKASPTNGPREIAMPMSRADIASYLGLSPESVSRASRRLERSGIVSFSGRHLVRIVNPSQFDRIETPT